MNLSPNEIKFLKDQFELLAIAIERSNNSQYIDKIVGGVGILLRKAATSEDIADYLFGDDKDAPQEQLEHCLVHRQTFAGLNEYLIQYAEVRSDPLISSPLIWASVDFLKNHPEYQDKFFQTFPSLKETVQSIQTENNAQKVIDLLQKNIENNAPPPGRWISRRTNMFSGGDTISFYPHESKAREKTSKVVSSTVKNIYSIIERNGPAVKKLSDIRAVMNNIQTDAASEAKRSGYTKTFYNDIRELIKQKPANEQSTLSNKDPLPDVEGPARP